MTTHTIHTLARLALDIQNAVNLQPILRAWSEAQPIICEHAMTTKVEARRHAVNILFMSKVASLMVVATDCIGGVYKGGAIEGYDSDLFVTAYSECEALAREAKAA